MTLRIQDTILTDALFCQRHDDIDVEINELIYLFNILVYAPSYTHTHTHTHTKAKENIPFLSIPFCLAYSFSDKLVNVHIKLNHAIL